jgi:KTSC domain
MADAVSAVGIRASAQVVALAAIMLLVPPALAAEVDVRHRGRLSLDDFDCSAVESSFIRRVCYDEENRYMLIQFGSVWYHYCNVPVEMVTGLLEAESAGRYFNANVRGRFGCRANQAPR